VKKCDRENYSIEGFDISEADMLRYRNSIWTSSPNGIYKLKRGRLIDEAKVNPYNPSNNMAGEMDKYNQADAKAGETGIVPTTFEVVKADFDLRTEISTRKYDWDPQIYNDIFNQLNETELAEIRTYTLAINAGKTPEEANALAKAKTAEAEEKSGVIAAALKLKTDALNLMKTAANKIPGWMGRIGDHCYTCPPGYDRSIVADWQNKGCVRQGGLCAVGHFKVGGYMLQLST